MSDLWKKKFDELENDAIDTIDAAIYTGDTFVSRDNIRRMREYMARWERGLKSIEKTCLLTD